MNPAAEGKVYPGVEFRVTPERVAAFRAVFGERRDVVPPTFLSAAEFSVLPTVVADPELGLDFSRVVHADQEYEWRRQIAIGETLIVRMRIAAIRTKGDNGFLTVETLLIGDDEEPAAVGRSTMIERGG